MRSHCIVVLGVPRSGTSCVAGVLHRIGVDMGRGHFQPKDSFNRRGYYEDLRWRLATQMVTGKGYDLRAAKPGFTVGREQKNLWRALAVDRKHDPLWGIKDTWMPFVGRWVIPILVGEGFDVRLVVTRRGRSASIASVKRHLKKTYKGRYKYGAERIINTWTSALEDTVSRFELDRIFVDYDRLVEQPDQVIPEIEAFVYAGTGAVATYNVAELVDWVSPDLRHF